MARLDELVHPFLTTDETDDPMDWMIQDQRDKEVWDRMSEYLRKENEE